GLPADAPTDDGAGCSHGGPSVLPIGEPRRPRGRATSQHAVRAEPGDRVADRGLERTAGVAELARRLAALEPELLRVRVADLGRVDERLPAAAFDEIAPLTEHPGRGPGHAQPRWTGAGDASDRAH